MVSFNYFWGSKIMAKKFSKNTKEWITTIIIMISTFFIIFNNVGQSIQLFQVPLSKNAIYWIAGICLGFGAVWTFYLNKVIKI